MMNSLVSIIIPVYNVEQYIDECLQSVFRQDYTNWELILIDDCSSDNSSTIINEYINKNPKLNIKFIRNEVNQGQGLSRNLGINIASGKWLFFLDADDLLELNCLSVLTAKTINNPDIVLGNSYNFKKGKKFAKYPDLLDYYKYSKYALGMYAWGTLFSRQYWLEHNFMFESCYAEDLWLISKVFSKTTNIIVLNECIYVYRVNYGSMTHTFQPFEKIHYVVERLLSYYLDPSRRTDELEAFVLSNCYNLMKMLMSPFERYKIYRTVCRFIASYPTNNYYAKPPLINSRKAKKLKLIYKSHGLSLFLNIDFRIIRQRFLNL